MTIGPRDKPYPIILHVDSNTGVPSKLAESGSIFVSSVSAITLSATTVCATNWVGIQAGPGTTDHGALEGLSDNDHPQYVLSATNTALSSLVGNLQTSAGELSSTISNHLASAVHWDANTLDSRFINASGDNVTGVFVFGAVSAANISATNAYIASTILFNTQVAPTLVVGQIGWNSTDQTIDIQTTVDTTLQVGQEQVILVENKSGAAIANGKVVYVSGTTGGSGKLNVGLASASSVNSETAFIIGVATQTINDNSTGFVTTFGKVNGIPLPTASFSDGDIVYLGDTPGEIRNYKPSKPSHGSFQLGRVIRAHDSNGILFVTIRGSVDMTEIHDVASSIPSNGQVLVWNTASGFYEPKNVSAISGIDNYATTASLNNYVLTSVNTNLSSLVNNLETSTASISSTVSNHIASAVHWDLATLNSNYINASGDSVTGAFTFGSVTGTSISATTYLNLPSALATWNASALQGKVIHTLAPGPGDVLAWDNNNSRWTPSAVTTGGVTNNPGGANGNIQFKNGGSFSGVDELTYNSTLSSLYARSLSSINVTGTSAYFTNYLNLPSVTALNGTGVLEVTSYSRNNYVLTSTNLTLSNTVTGHINDSTIHFTAQSLTSTYSVTSHAHSQYVLTATNFELSNTVTNHLASAVHWDLATLNSNYINASGDSANASFFFSGLSATNFSATTYLNLPSVTALNGTGIFEVTSYSRNNYVLTSTNLALSNTVTGHLASAVHWDLTTLNANYVNASGDSVTGSFFFQNLSATNFSAATYLNLPSVTSLAGTGVFSLTSHNHSLTGLNDVFVTATPTNGQSLVWSSTKWIASSIGGGTVGGGSLNATAIQGVPVCATAPTYTNQAFVYNSTQNKWGPGYTVYQSTATPNNIDGSNGDIYFQYDQSSTLSGLSDTQIAATPTTGQVLAWNSNKWVPSSITTGGAAAVGSNYRFQFYKDGSLSSVNFGYDPNTYGGSISSTLPITTNAWMYAGQNLGVEAGIVLYGPNAGGDGYLQNAGAGVSAVSANALLTPSLSATTVSATNYSGISLSASLRDVQITSTPATNSVLKWDGTKWYPGTDQTGVGGGPAGTNYEFQFYNDGNFSAVAGIEYSPNLFGNPQFIISGAVGRLYVDNSIYTPYITAANTLTVGTDTFLTSPSTKLLKVDDSISSTTVIADTYKNTVSTITATSITLPSSCVDKLFISCVSNTTIVLPNATECTGKSLQFIKSDVSGWPINISSVYLKTPTSAIMINIPRDVVNLISDGNYWYVENTRNVYGHGRAIYFDEFIIGNNETGEVGDLAWAFLNGNVNWISPTSTLYGGQYVGLIRRATTTTTNQIAYMTLNQAGTEFVADTQDYLEVRTRTAISGTATQFKYRIGLHGGTTITSAVPANGIYFETSAAAISPSNWIAVTIRDSTGTFTDTGFSDVTGLHALRFFRREHDGAIEFYINNKLITTHTTNIPLDTTPMNPVANITPTSAAQRSFVLDYFGYCLLNKYSNRYL